MKIKDHSYILFLSILLIASSFAFPNFRPTIGDLFAGYYFMFVLLITYALRFSKKRSFLILEASRFSKLIHFYLWKLKEIFLQLAIDLGILILVGSILVVIQNGSLNLLQMFITFLALLLLLTIFGFFSVLSKLFYKTAFPVLALFFVLDAYTIVDITANPYINPFANIHLTFYMYKPVPETGAIPEIQNYALESIAAYGISLVLIAAICLLFIHLKKRKIEL